VPTIDEAGLPRPVHSILACVLARGVPSEVITKLNAAAKSALKDPTQRQRLIDLGQEIPADERQTPEALAAFQRAEIEKWWPIIEPPTSRLNETCASLPLVCAGHLW
jgi:tripartite-type tricarboxylate transporter receptor subunit TctC